MSQTVGYYRRKFQKIESRNNTVEVSMVKIMTVLITLMCGFVIPAQLLDSLSRQSSQPTTALYAAPTPATTQVNGRIAGANTSNPAAMLSSTFNNFLNDKQSMVLIGSVFIGVSVIIISYVLLSSNSSTQRRLESELI